VRFDLGRQHGQAQLRLDARGIGAAQRLVAQDVVELAALALTVPAVLRPRGGGAGLIMAGACCAWTRRSSASASSYFAKAAAYAGLAGAARAGCGRVPSSTW
jgi:hypothetical protein